MSVTLPTIYPITDARISGISHSEQVRRLIDGGGTLIQIREKYLSAGEWFAEANRSVKIAHECGVKIIINDRVDLAIAIGADGVHLGQNDLPPHAARRLLGPDAIIGYSTHTIEQARAATALPVDYIAFGPVFHTISKKDPDPTVGLQLLRRVRLGTGDFPLVAIGGINAGNLAQIFAAGANSAAMIGAILSKPTEIYGRMLDLTRITEK